MKRGRVAFVVALGLNIALVLGARYFPFEDSTNDLARYVLLERAWWGHGASFIAVHPVPGPYLGVDALGALFVHFLGAVWALRAMAAVTVSAIPLGFYWLLSVIDPGGEATEWALIGVLLGFGYFTHAGFINYVVGVGVALACLAVWWPGRARPSPGRLVAIVAGVIVCYLSHLSSALMVLAVVGVDWLLARDRRIVVLLFLCAVVGGMMCWTYLGAPPPPPDIVEGGVSYPSLVEKVRNIPTPFYAYSTWQALVMFAAYVLGVVLFLSRNPVFMWRATWTAAAAGFAVLYFIFPSATSGGGYLDLRWLIPAYLLLFCVAGAGTSGPTRTGLALLLAGSVASSVVLWRSVLKVDAYLVDFAALLDQLPPGQRVFPIVADDLRFGARVIPYRHFALWYEIDRGGRVPGLFNFGGDGPGSTPNWFMPYFDEPSHLYAPPMGWFGGKVRHIVPLDWSRIASDYDYVVVAGPDSAIRAEVGIHTNAFAHVGEIAAYVPFSATSRVPPSP